MKTILDRTLIALLLSFSGINLYAQRSGPPWWDLMDDPTANFDTIVHYGFEWFDNHKDQKAPNGMSIEVYNQLGSLVGSSFEKIDVSNFESGLYFLVVKTEKGAETKKFIKHE